MRDATAVSKKQEARSDPWRLRARLESLQLLPEHEADIIDELAQHLDDRVRELLAGGTPPEAAHAVALADLDAPGELARRLADIVGRPPLRLPPPGAPSHGRWLQARWQDLRYSIRALRRSPAFALTVIVTLGLTIGPTSALLSIGNWLLWRPTPGVTAPDRLGLTSFEEQTQRYAIVMPLSYPNLDDLRRLSRSVDAISGFHETDVNLVAGLLPAEESQVGYVTADFFDALGVRVVEGRGFRPDDDQWPHGSAVVVISDGLARRAFGGAPQALNGRVLLNGVPMTVAGVLSPEFVGAGPFSRVSVWVTGASYGNVTHAAAPTSVARSQGLFNSFVIRLAPGASFTTAQAELDSVLSGLVAAHPAENKGLTKVRAKITPGLGLKPDQRQRYATQVGTLMAIGGVLVLLGCANVASVMMARSLRGQRERAVRLALGASRSRLMLLQLTESVVLAAGGAALGVLLAVGLKQFVAAMFVPVVSTWPDFSVPLDSRVLAMTIGVSVACGLAAGVLPAFSSVRARFMRLAGEAGGRSVTGPRRLRAGLAVTQLALSLALVTGAIMLIVTLRNLAGVDLGIDPAGVTAHKLDSSRQGYAPERRVTYYQQVFERLRGQPGLAAVSLSAAAFGSNRRLRVQDPADAGSRGIEVMANAVTADYFDVLRIRMIAGRRFTDQEALTTPATVPRLVIVNEQLARRLYGEANAIGQRLVLPPTSRSAAREFSVVGVVTDARWSPTGEPAAEMFFPLTSPELGITSVALLVRSAEPDRRVLQRVQAAAFAVDPTLPVRFSVPFSAEMAFKLADRTTFAWVLSALGWLGFALAAVGLHGLLAQSVVERTREFGVRLAVGSGRAHIFGLVMRQAAWIGGLGTIIGLGLAVAGSRLIEAQLFGVTRAAAGVYAAASIALLAIVFVAGLWPARAATRIEPVDALRVE